MRVSAEDKEVVGSEERREDTGEAEVPGRETSPAGKSRVGRLADMRLLTAMLGEAGRPGGGRAGRGAGNPEDRLDAACAIVARDFTPDEWRRYLPERPWEPTCTDRA